MMPATTIQPQGGNSALASLFRNNTAAAPGAMPQQLPQIMAPQTPNIGMPPPRAQMPIQAAAPQGQASPVFNSISQLMHYTGANPGKLSPETANMWKSLLQRKGGR